LRQDDDRQTFHSGNIELDGFLRRYASQNQFRHHIGTTYVVDIGQRIAGFVTVSAAHLEADRLSPALKKRLRNYPLPVLRIARLAVDADHQGQGIGIMLLKAMFELALEMRDKLGCVGVVVDAKSDAVTFYERFGFIALDVVQGCLGDRPKPQPMFLSIKTVAQASGR
jgi:GNAT superfamily N-acetyltransferase